MMERSALYATIRRQPEAVEAVIGAPEAPFAEAAALLAAAPRITLAGTGTSSHAAVVGEHLLRAAGLPAHATTPFDWVTYPRPPLPGEVLIAIGHTGTTRFTGEALARAAAMGLASIGITGIRSPMRATLLLRTVEPETSATYTASYTAALAALARLAVLAGRERGLAMEPLLGALRHLPAYIATMLQREAAVLPLARTLATRGRLVLAGAGPNAATAREGALKVKESCYLSAEGFELETMLHGGLQAVEQGDIAVVIAAGGPALARAADLTRALSTIGATLVLVADEAIAADLAPAGRVQALPAVLALPPVPEVLSPVLAVIPLQLLAALTAEQRGTNPDDFRFGQDAYKQAFAGLTL